MWHWAVDTEARGKHGANTNIQGVIGAVRGLRHQDDVFIAPRPMLEQLSRYGREFRREFVLVAEERCDGASSVEGPSKALESLSRTSRTSRRTEGDDRSASRGCSSAYPCQARSPSFCTLISRTALCRSTLMDDEKETCSKARDKGRERKWEREDAEECRLGGGCGRRRSRNKSDQEGRNETVFTSSASLKPIYSSIMTKKKRTFSYFASLGSPNPYLTLCEPFLPPPFTLQK